MKFGVRHFLCISLLAAGTVHGADELPNKPMRPVADCINTSRINEWYVLDAQTVTVRTGPDRYLVKTEASCPWLGTGQKLGFRASPDKRAIGLPRICGDSGDVVFSRDQPPCGVQAVTKLDKATFDQMKAQAKHNGFIAGQASVRHP
jgi:Family of unknown function (DUF6491)